MIDKEIYTLWKQYSSQMMYGFNKDYPDRIITNDLIAAWAIAASQLVRASIEKQKSSEGTKQ
jgi:hypothetical protein